MAEEYNSIEAVQYEQSYIQTKNANQYDSVTHASTFTYNHVPWRVAAVQSLVDVTFPESGHVQKVPTILSTIYMSPFREKDRVQETAIRELECVAVGSGKKAVYNVPVLNPNEPQQADEFDFTDPDVRKKQVPLNVVIAGKTYTFISFSFLNISMNAASSPAITQNCRNIEKFFSWLQAINIPQFATGNDAVLYVNGVIDADKAVVPPHDFEADENDENDNDKNASTFEPTPSNTPQVRPTDIQGASNYYCVNAANVNAFVNWLWNDLIKEGSLSDWLLDSITKINGNLYSCITGLRLFPCNISKHLAVTQNTGINLGRFTTEFQVIDARSYTPKIGELEYTIPSGYNNFLDYQPYTTGLLYLPFVGFTQLDMTVFQPKSTMKIECYVDITTGVIDYVIYLKTDKGYSLIEHHSGTCGIEIPMSYDNASNWLQNFVGGAIKDGVNTIGGKGATSLGEMAISATGGLLDSFETPTSYNVGAPSPSNGLYFPFRPHIVIKRPTYSRPKSYSKNVGYPCMKSLKPKSLSGYTVFQNPQLTFGHTENSEGQKVLPTKEEMDMLYQLMTEGVYL